MKVRRRAILKNIKAGKRLRTGGWTFPLLAEEINENLDVLLCARSDENPLEMDSGIQKLAGAWFGSKGAFSPLEDDFFRGSLIWQLEKLTNFKTMKGSLVVYGIYPEPGEGLPWGPVGLAQKIVEFLAIPPNQPVYLFTHLDTDNIIHAHILFSRYDLTRPILIQEGKDRWPLKGLRSYIDANTIPFSSATVAEIIGEIPGIEEALKDLAALPEFLSKHGITVAEQTDDGSIVCSAWGASETFRLGG